MANLNQIVTINIDIHSPAVSSAGFGNVLLVGDAPKTPGDFTPPDVGVYTELEGVTEMGWKATGTSPDPIGSAARIAFSQNPQPAKIFIAVRKPLAYTADLPNMDLPVGTVVTFNQAATPRVTPRSGNFAAAYLSLGGNKNNVLGLWTNDGGANTSFGFFTLDTDTQTALPTRPPFYTTSGGWAAESYTLTAPLQSDDTPSFNLGGETGFSFATDITITPPVEDIDVTLDRALKLAGWYVICPAGVDESEYAAIAEWTEAHTKLFAYTFLTDNQPVDDIYYRSLGWYGRQYEKQLPDQVPEANKYLHVAATVKWLYWPPGSETLAFKQLAAVYDSDITATTINDLTMKHLNYYAMYGGKRVTMLGQVRGGEWADVIRFRDGLQDEMQYRIYNLFLVNPKIPYTDAGIALIYNAIQASLKAGQKAGGIAPTEYDEDGNAVPGYTITVPRSMDLSASQKASRVLTGVKFSARLAGAIHAVVVDGTLTY